MRKILIGILGISLLMVAFYGGNQYVFGLLRADAEEIPDLTEALTLFYTKEPDVSLDKFRQLADANPDNIAMKLNLIRLQNEMGKYNDSIAQLRLLQAQNPQNIEYRTELIRTTYLGGQWKETIKLSDKVSNLTAAELFWRGMAHMELGFDREAIQDLIDSRAKDDFNPMANFVLGQLYQKNADFEKAVDFYKKAAVQEPNMTTIYFPLAKAYMALRKYQTAYSFLLNAKAAYPRDPEIAGTLRKLMDEYPELLQQQLAEAQKRRQITTVPQVTPVIQDRDKIPMIRIGLAERIKKCYFKTGAKFELLSGSRRYQGEAQAILSVKSNGKTLEIRDEHEKLIFAGDGRTSLIYNDPAATTILFDVQYGQGTFWSGREDRVYRGNFQFLMKQQLITIVNCLNVEEYLYGVVPAEMQPAWPRAALEAQAVAARTYAFANLKRFEARGFDLRATVASQVYRGAGAEKNSTNAAVDASRGRILQYNRKPINAVYTGNNGGYSANSQDVWGFKLPYLQAVPDKFLSFSGPLGPTALFEWLTTRPRTYSSHPQYSARSSFRWVAWVSRAEIESRLNLGNKLGRIRSVEVAGRSINSMVTKVLIRGSNGKYTVSGDKIRTRLGGLRSNTFVVMPKMDVNGQPESFLFYGGGWGHGVGMCQSGAAGMAADGYLCDEILKHFYQGAEAVNLY